uniref:NUP160 middle TPR domain-containing protein n=1 Tax=Ditylenchus dipsaci TaxID=166011 RepID=A0A915D4U2_9BILA
MEWLPKLTPPCPLPLQLRFCGGVCLHDKQLVAVTFQSSANNQNCLVSDEVVLQGNNMFNRIFKGKVLGQTLGMWLWTGIQDGVWEEVQSAGTDTKMNSLLFKFSETEAVKNRNNYSFSVVNRAVQIACKQPKQQFEQNDWLGLADFVQEFIESGHSSIPKLRLEADLQPLSFVYSPNLGLIGVIQLCRFTVYLPPDELMRAICQPNNKVVSKFFEIVKPFLKTGHVPTSMDVNSTLETITNHTDELCRVIRAFAEHRPVDVANNLADAKSDFLASSFSTGFLPPPATSHNGELMEKAMRMMMMMKTISWDLDQFCLLLNGMKPATFSSPSSSSKHQRPVKEKPFESFVRELIAGSIITLWPESTSLTLPRFLAENGFFDALKNYCSLNETFVSELAYALRFFQGISYSGLGKPEIAWKAFEEISLGVLTGDDALNSLLGLIMYSNDTPATTEPKKHSLAEYYNEPEIFTTLFTQQLVSKNFREALRTLLINPSKEKQSACLRQLLTFLVDSGDTRTLVDLSYDHLTDVVVDILETRCRSDSVSNSAVSDIYDVVFAFHQELIQQQTSPELSSATECRQQFFLGIPSGVTCAAFYPHSWVCRHMDSFITDRFQNGLTSEVLSVAFETLGIAEPGKNVVQFEVELRGHKNHGEASSSINLDTDEDQMDASTSNTYPSERLLTLTIEDIGRELVQAEARLELLDVDQLSVPPTNYEDILRESLKHKRYDMAWVIIREFGLHPYDLLEEVTKQAILADHYLSSVGECDTEWALANRQFLVKTRELALQHWPHDTKILRTVAYVFLGYSVQIPAWLETQYKALNFGDFLCSLTDFGDLEDAFKQLLSELDAAIRKVTAGKLDIIVPYSHIDRLFDLAKKVDGGHLPVEETRKKISKFSSLYDSIRKATSVI